jgi:arginyl-tRNA--protein-N-Asp/Glu arginylyltransferase
MMNHSEFDQQTAYACYMSQLHDCSYLPGQEARNLFLDPMAKVTPQLYQQLIDQGFRRSGCYLYQPACPNCNSCISLRIPVDAYQPSRSQRRNWKENSGAIQATPVSAQYYEEHFQLYKRYLGHRHPDGAMVCNSPGQYSQFLTCDWAETRFIEFREGDRLVAVAVSDLLPNGTSSVYTFFDPELRQRGLGVYALMWQIAFTRELGLKWVYPGFWIESCQKMNYKSRFRPYQAWTGQHWIEIPAR